MITTLLCDIIRYIIGKTFFMISIIRFWAHYSIITHYHVTFQFCDNHTTPHHTTAQCTTGARPGSTSSSTPVAVQFELEFQLILM